MARIDTKKLLILGQLRRQGLHGYGLAELVSDSAIHGVELKKSNAYQLLNRMEEDGWIVSTTEQEGNRPPRQVFSLTVRGEQAFQELLRTDLAVFQAPQVPGVVSLNHLGLLTGPEAAGLLSERRDQLRSKLAMIAALPEEDLESRPGIDLMSCYLALELEWLDERIRELSHAES